MASGALQADADQVLKRAQEPLLSPRSNVFDLLPFSSMGGPQVETTDELEDMSLFSRLGSVRSTCTGVYGTFLSQECCLLSLFSRPGFSVLDLQRRIWMCRIYVMNIED